jgi:DNA-binding SARP family transcriptional activator
VDRGNRKITHQPRRVDSDNTAILQGQRTSDLADLTAADGEQADDVLPPTVFLTTAPAGSLGTRLTAILTVGARLGVVGVVLGTWPAGQTWQVNTDGTTNLDGQAKDSGPRLNILDRAAALDILDTVQQAHPTTDDLSPAPPAVSKNVVPAQKASPDQATSHDQQQPAAATAPPTRTASAPSGRLSLTVLGKPTIARVDGERRTELRIRRSAGMQILIYLAVNPNGATSDELMTILWPEIRPRYARGSFHTTISDLRQYLAEAVGGDQPGVEPIPRTDERYHLDARGVDIDLWAFNATVDEAATAVQPAEHAAALRKVISLYTGAVAEGHNWLWLTAYRETTRRQVLDAYVALADADPEPRQALTLIQDAIRLEPYNEDLYQRAMRLHARLGSSDGVRRTLRTLSERLAELEVQMSTQTQQVAAEVLERLDIRQRASNSAA